VRGKNWQIGTEVTQQGNAKTAEESRSQAGTEGAKPPLLLRETKQNWVLLLGLAALHPSLAS